MKKLKFFALACLAAAVPAPTCAAADWSSLYETPKLENQKPRLQEAVDFVIKTEIQPFVPRAEATLLALQPIDLPLSGFRTDPLDFYSEGKHILLPVRTLLFVEDLARAYGWMWANHYTTQTADEYLNMLRFRKASDFAGNRFPAPLEALHIPDNALSDSRVVETSVRLRRSAYAFLILHEYGHLKLHHSLNEKHGFSDGQEEEADLYALSALKANSNAPIGVFLVIYSSMFLENGTGAAIHPVTPHRLDAVARYLELHSAEFVSGRMNQQSTKEAIFSLSKMMREGSQGLQLHGRQEELQQLALKTDISTLKPRPLPPTTR